MSEVMQSFSTKKKLVLNELNNLFLQDSRFSLFKDTTLKSPVALTQNSLDSILANINQSGKVVFKDVLDQHGYSSDISHVQLDAHWSNQTGIDFSGCSFDSVTFTGNIVNALFSSNNMTNCAFQDARVAYSVFDNANIDHCIFLNTEFRADSIQNSCIEQSWFINDEMTLTTFENNQITETIFSDIKTNYVEPVIAIENTTSDLGFINAYIAENLNQGNINVKQTQPVVGVIGHSDWHSPADNAIKVNSGNTVTIDPYNLPSAILNKLDFDVEQCLRDYKGLSVKPEGSIAQYILNSDYSSIVGIKQIAKDMIDNVDGLWIPGEGYDIHPAFYGESTQYYTSPSYSYTREMFEFALIEEALHQNKPLIGVCHGAQMINVFLDGDLHQHVENQWDDQYLTVEISEGIIGDAIKDGIWGESMHHQAMRHVGKGLEVVASYQGIIKACQADNGAPIFLTQFHPEYMGDQANKNIVNNFVKASNKSNAHTTALELGDILNIDSKLVQSLGIKYQEGEFKLHADTLVHTYESTAEASELYSQHSNIVMPSFDDLGFDMNIEAQAAACA